MTVNKTDIDTTLNPIKDIMDKSEDLGIKFGSPLEAKWTQTLNRIEESILVDKINVKLAEASLKIAIAEIAKEKERYK